MDHDIWQRSRAAQIEALLTSVVPKPGEGPQRKHYITNIIVTLAGDRASARSDYLVVRESERGLMPVMGGTYMDEFDIETALDGLHGHVAHRQRGLDLFQIHVLGAEQGGGGLPRRALRVVEPRGAV